jgi:putative membrane protein
LTKSLELIARLLVNGLAVYLVTLLLPGVQVLDMLTAIMVAAVLALLNYFVKPILLILTIPITIFTLGLFILVINAFIVLMASSIIPGFEVRNFWWALLFSIILSIVNSFFEASRNNRQSE